MPQAQQENGPTRSAADLEEYFDALTAAATTEKEVLEYLVKSNAALTTNNSELSAAVDSLVKASEQLSCWVGNCCNNRTREYSPALFPETLFPHCNIELMHAPDNFFELNKNSNRCPRGWKSNF